MTARWLALLMMVVCWIAPSVAFADPAIATDDDDPKRHGFVPALRMTSGVAFERGGTFAPVTRISFMFGGAVSDRVVLGGDIGTSAWWDAKKAGFHGDAFAQIFVVRGLFVRGTLGAESVTYVGESRRAAVGGSLGTGWEFRFGRRGFASLEADYDLRVRGDGMPVNTMLFGIRLGGYVQKKRR